MADLKTIDEIEKIRASSVLVSKTLAEVGKMIRPGITPEELDVYAEGFIRDNGGTPAFLGHHGFPSSLCISVNEAVVHGIPYQNRKPLAEGDIVSLDCGVQIDGFYGDGAFTFPVGEISDELKDLLRVTRESLDLGVAMAIAGNRIGDIGFSVQEHAERHGYGVVRELVGHGVGKAVWEKPEVPNYGKRGSGIKLEENMVIAIEPMINLGKAPVKWLKDGWTVVTADNKHSAHFEHTVAIKKGKPDILTTFDFIDEVFQVNGVR